MLARTKRVVLVDLALAAPNIDVFSNDTGAPGIADLVRGAASFGDIITRDKSSRLQLVAAGNVGDDAEAMIGSHMLLSAVDALGQSYDYLVVDAGALSGATIGPIAQITARAVLVGGDAPEASLDEMREQLLSAGFAEVAVLTGKPPELNHATTVGTAAA
jgi:MinD-like ATPase involved in chromosome partitioning or flagellar assembly